MRQTKRPSAGLELAPRLAGAVALAVTAGIHLDLYLTGYRHIPTISWLFLLQVIVAFVLAVAVLVFRGPLSAAAGAGFAISTLGGYLLTLWIGLFGFQEVRTTAGVVAGLVEIAAFGLLGYAALASLPHGALPGAAGRAPSGGSGPGKPREAGRTGRGLPGSAVAAVGALSAVALIVLGVSLGTASSGGTGAASAAAPSGSGPVMKITIKNFMYSPDNPDVQPSERIEITNEDSVAHTFTAGPSAKDKNLFTTGVVNPHQTKTIKAPGQPGMYPFYCTIHNFMTGMLIVGK